MELRLKRLTMLFLACALLALLVTGTYGALSANSAPAEKKGKNLKQSVGKNWDIKTDNIEHKEKPKPIKTLKNQTDHALDEKAIESRVNVPKKNLDPVSDQQ